MRMNFTKNLCPPRNLSINIQGKYTDEIFKFIQISIKKCNSSSPDPRPCVNDSILQAYLDKNSLFSVNLYFINKIINPSTHSLITYYLSDRNYLQFNLNYGGLINAFITPFRVTTDNSILPYQSEDEESGCIVNNVGQFIGFQNSNASYGRIILRRGSSGLIGSRSFTKIDEVLSFVGGLFGFMLVFLVFMNVYTEVSF